MAGKRTKSSIRTGKYILNASGFNRAIELKAQQLVSRLVLKAFGGGATGVQAELGIPFFGKGRIQFKSKSK